MKRIVELFFTLLIVCALSASIFPQESSEQVNPGLLSAILKLENYLQRADENIQRYEKSIDRCDKNIKASSEILQSSRQQGNSEAERIATNALRKSTDTRQKNVNLINTTNHRKSQCQSIIASLRKQSSSNSSHTTAALLNYSGNVTLRKANGTVSKLNENNGATIEDGDAITTAEKSKVEMQFLDGRGHLVLGENSGMKFKQEDSTDVVDMIEGKIKMDVEKVEAFYADLERKYEEYKKLAVSPDKALELLYAKTRAFVGKRLRKFEVRTPSVVLADRGTDFIAQYRDKNLEVIVLEGMVEMKSNIGGKTAMVNVGQKGIFGGKEQLLEVRDIDVSKEDSWWKDEE